MIGAGAQEAFQLVDSAATVFYGIAYSVMFAIPLAGAASISRAAPRSVRIAAGCGLIISLLAIVFTVFPIVDVRSPLVFGAKIIAVSLAANAIGVAIFLADRRKIR